MADLTQEIGLTTSWKDIGVAGSLTSGKTYVGDLRGVMTRRLAPFRPSQTTRRLRPLPATHGVRLRQGNP